MRAVMTVVALVFLSVVIGMVAGNAAMYSVYFYGNGEGPPVRHQPEDMIAAAYASMIGAGAAGFAVARWLRR